MNCLLHRWWLRGRLRRLDAAIGRAVARAGAHGDGLQLHEMQRVVEAEKTLQDEKERLRDQRKTADLRALEVADLERRLKEKLQKLAGLNEAEARAAR